MKILIKKEIYEDWVSLKTFKNIHSFLYPIYKWFYNILGYEVERSDDID